MERSGELPKARELFLRIRRGRSRRLRRGRAPRIAGAAHPGPSDAEPARVAPVRLERHGSRTTARRRGRLAAQLTAKAAFPAEHLLPPRPRPPGSDLRRLGPVVRRCSATWAPCTTPAAWAAPATSRSSRSTRASSTRRRPASPSSRPTSIRPSSATWPSPATATPSPPPSGGWASCRGATSTRSPSS